MGKEKETYEISARELRRKRRIRNQILAYITLIVFVIAVVIGLVFGIKALTKHFSEKKQKEEAAEQEAMEAEKDTEEEEEEEEEPLEEYTEDDLLHEMVDTFIDDLTVEDRVAGLFLTTPEALTGIGTATQAGDTTEKALSEYPVGGLVYARSNVQSEEQFTKMLTDTISRSKYPLFFVMDDTETKLGDDLSAYGVNTEFTEKEGEEGLYIFRTVTLASLLGDVEESGIVTAQIDAEEDAVADACLEAWQNGADLLYVKKGFQIAYEGMLEAVKGDEELERKVRDSLEQIYLMKYKKRLEE